MPIKSLTLNGFLGGINLDADLSDLQSEDERGGKNHLVQCKNFNCNQPGKIRSKNPGAASGSGDLSSAGSPSATDDFLIHGTTYYRKQGVYKLGEDVEWSGKNNITRPIKSSANIGKNNPSNIKTDTVGLNVYGTEEASTIDQLFIGKMATQNSGDAKLANLDTIKGEAVGTATGYTSSYVKWAVDRDEDDDWSTNDLWNPDNSANIRNIYVLGDFSTEGGTVGFWDESVASSDGSGGSFPTSEDEQDNAIGWQAKENSGGLVPGLRVPSGGANTKIPNASISNTDYIRFGINNSTEGNSRQSMGVIFRTGNIDTLVAGDNLDGLYDNSLNITDKDIMIEVSINGDTSTSTGAYGAGSFYTAFNKIVIVANSSSINYHQGWYDSTGTSNKTWTISKDELVSYGAIISDNTGDHQRYGTAGGARIKIPYGSAVHTGSSFVASSVTNFTVWLDCDGPYAGPDHTDPLTAWVARLFEVSFLPADTIGWENTSTVFSQSKIYTSSSTNNKVESLPQAYDSVLSMPNSRTLGMRLYKPILASGETSYEGNIYYQQADDNGNPIGSLFLLAEVSYAKGVRNILNDNFVPWPSSTTEAECNLYDSVDSEGWNFKYSGVPKPEVGMLVTPVADSAIAAGTYIKEIIAIGDGTDLSCHLKLSNTPTSVQTDKVVTFSGKTDLTIPNPPISTTYQLSSGYSQDTEMINAVWKHSAVIGRQIYIGDIISTGDELSLEAVSLANSTLSDYYPIIDTIGTTLFADTDIRIKIQSDVSKFQWSVNGGSSYNGVNISIATTYTQLGSHGIYVRFPDSSFTYTQNDEWKYQLKNEKDRILKSAIGKRYGFSDLDYVDLELPGTGITAMYPAGDRLLVFSSSQLTIVNVAQDYEFLEATMAGHGVTNAKQVVEVGEGVAFVNSTGVYYFDGNNMNNISDDLMMTYDWSAAQAISYIPSEKLICVYIGASNDLYAYSLNTKSWVSRSTSSGTTPSTRVKFYNNEATYLNSTYLNKLVVEDYAASGAILETGKISCGNMSMIKKFIKMYVTTVNGAELEVAWSLDGGSYSSATDLTDNGTDEIAINGTGKTIQLKFSSDETVVAGTEISEIRLIYRDLRIK